ncbi:hypothetical protein PYR71_23670 [Rhizobium sp. MC63]|uniref:Uncharacterized protein n=1 Tax=Rhizobium mulingense TaxID=3031128 RepID=A0ACC6N2U9_9HYPH|nr:MULTISPECIES: hypothetical protein [unclassified Rhizobium]MDF0699448.1 hypothetical protein [Rhizobium sp. MC63]MEA3519765.1 hypothetical protein [Rhizobium sp. MJ31]
MISLRQLVFDLRKRDVFFICSQTKNESMHGKRAQVEADESLTDSMNGFNPMAELGIFSHGQTRPVE